MTSSHILPRATETSPPPNPKNWAFPVADRKNSLFEYLDLGTFDEENGLLFFEEKKSLSIGFALWRNRSRAQACDTDWQIEGLISRVPQGTVLQFGTLNTPAPLQLLDTWMHRHASPEYPLLAERNRSLVAKFLDRESNLTDNYGKLTDGRVTYQMVFVRIPVNPQQYALDNREAIVQWAKDTRCSFGSYTGVFEREDYEAVIEALAFPRQGLTSSRLTNSKKDPNTTVRIPSQEVSSDVLVTPLTVDQFPSMLDTQAFSNLLGEGSALALNFPPYWAYTTIEVLDRRTLERRLDSKRYSLKAALTLTPRQKYHNELRASEVDAFLLKMNEGHLPVRAYTGINLYTAASNREVACDTVQRRFRQFGYRISPEKHLTAPAYIASLPFQYRADENKPGKGLQRASLMHSLNAASLVPTLTSESPVASRYGYTGGALVTTHRSEIATIDPWEMGASTYNFLVLGENEEDKLVVSREIACDALTRGGSVCVLDLYGEFSELQTLTGTPSTKLTRKAPVSFDPFTGLDFAGLLRAHSDIDYVLAALLVTMSFQGSRQDESKVSAAEALVSETIHRCIENTTHLEMQDIFQALKSQDSTLSQELARGLSAFVVGEYSEWFTGTNPLDLTGQLTIVDFSELFSSDRQRSSGHNPLINALVQCALARRRLIMDLDIQKNRALPKLTLLTDSSPLKSYQREDALSYMLRQRKWLSSVGIICREDPERFLDSQFGKALWADTNLTLFLQTPSRKIDTCARDSKLVTEETAQLWREVAKSDQHLDVLVQRAMPEFHQEIYRMLRQEPASASTNRYSTQTPPVFTAHTIRHWSAPVATEPESTKETEAVCHVS